MPQKGDCIYRFCGKGRGLREARAFRVVSCYSVVVKLLLTTCLLITPTIAAAQSRAEIKAAEQRLADLGYATGRIDGVLDATTRAGLIAFQKYEALPITGKLELENIRNAQSPYPREPGYAHVEIDLDRQIMLMVDEAGAVKVLPVSSGTGKPFIDQGQQSVAYTPRGRFMVYDKVAGWDHGPIGSLYYPNYISGGVAIHGARSVPTEPASHGCIRIPMFAGREVSQRMKLGTIVLVYDKVSFVSALDWVKNPALKEAAYLSLRTPDYDYSDTSKRSGTPR